MRVAAFAGAVCMAILIASGANAGKPDKPSKPDEPSGAKECIVFTGDLAGAEVVEGCCPNAGPYPAYTMTLDIEPVPYGSYEGQLFMNFVGTGPSQQYKVQFWTWDLDTETPGTDDFFFEIYGGEVAKDKKTKLLTVTFNDELGTVWVYNAAGYPTDETAVRVSFELVRTSNLAYCQE
jgi:hypothetical protein